MLREASREWPASSKAWRVRSLRRTRRLARPGTIVCSEERACFIGALTFPLPLGGRSITALAPQLFAGDGGALDQRFKLSPHDFGMYSWLPTSEGPESTVWRPAQCARRPNLDVPRSWSRYPRRQESESYPAET